MTFYSELDGSQFRLHYVIGIGLGPSLAARLSVDLHFEITKNEMTNIMIRRLPLNSEPEVGYWAVK